MRLRTLGLALTLATSLSLPALALPPDVQKRADEMFQQGRGAMEQGDYRKALKIFRTSHELDPTRGKLLNMAVCEEHLGMVASALAHVQEVDRQIPKDDPRRPIVDDYLAKLPPRVPSLRLALAPDAPAETSLTLDGAPLATTKLGLKLPLDPGPHVLLVLAPGRAEKRYDVHLQEGQKATLEVQPGNDSSPAVPISTGPVNAGLPPPVSGVGANADSSKRNIAPVFVLGGIGALGVGAGIAFVVARGGKVSEAQALSESIAADGKYCASGEVNYDAERCPTLGSTTSSGDVFGTAAVVSFVVGGFAATGAVLYAAWPSSSKKAAPAVSFRWAPVVSQRQQGMAFWGSF